MKHAVSQSFIKGKRIVQNTGDFLCVLDGGKWEKKEKYLPNQSDDKGQCLYITAAKIGQTDTTNVTRVGESYF